MQRDYTYDPDKIFAELEKAAELMADRQYEADLLSELQKPTLATIILRHIKSGLAVNRAEQEALADPDYEKHVRGMVAAKREANKSKSHYRNLEALADARRTQEASTRRLAA
jgi:hypothetical protein